MALRDAAAAATDQIAALEQLERLELNEVALEPECKDDQEVLLV